MQRPEKTLAPIYKLSLRPHLDAHSSDNPADEMRNSGRSLIQVGHCPVIILNSVYRKQNFNKTIGHTILFWNRGAEVLN